MGLLGKTVSVISILKRPFCMPVSRVVFAFLIVFGGGAVGMRRQFVLFSGFPMLFVHV
jgi:hypothetical protein